MIFQLAWLQLRNQCKYHLFVVVRQGTSIIQVTATDQDKINDPVTYEIVECKYSQYQSHIRLFNMGRVKLPQRRRRGQRWLKSKVIV